jgi:hypothetical protein
MKDLKTREILSVRLQKLVRRKTIAAKRADPYSIQVNGDEHLPIFVDVRENLLVTGQTLSAAPGYAIGLTKQLLEKNHIIHAKTTYEGADSMWFFLHTFGFVTDTTADRHINGGRHKKDSPRFAFHLFSDKHHIIEDTVNGGKLLANPDIDLQAPMDIVFYLKKDANPSVEHILIGDMALSEKLDALQGLPGSRITKLTHNGSLSECEIPSLASLSDGFNHIVIAHVPSETAFEYKNRLHLRDVSKACGIYFKERQYEFGWNLQLSPMGYWVIVTPDVEPIIQRSYATRSKYGYSWNARHGQ